MKEIFKKLIDILDYRLFIGIAVIWVLILIIPGFIPDLLNLRSIIEEKELIAILLSIITSLFGILIAFILLSFGIFRDKFGRVALSFLIKERNFRFLINLLLSVSLHLLFSYIIINNNNVDTDFSVTLAYISIYFFILSLFLLFPISFSTLLSPDSLKNVEDCISNITRADLDDLNSNKGLSDLESVEKIDTNSMFVAQRYGVSLIKSDDKLGFLLLLKKLNEKILSLVDENPERYYIGDIYSIYTDILQSFIRELISQKDEKSLKTIWAIIGLNHKHFADKKIQLLYLEKFDFFVSNYIDIILLNKLDNVTKYGLNTIENILVYHYKKSLPLQSKISMLMDIFEQKKIDHDVDTELQWNKISHEIPYYYTIILRKCIELKNLNIFSSTLYQLNYLSYEVIRSDYIGEYQKAFILNDLLSDYFYYQIEAFNNKFYIFPKEIKFPSTDIFIKAIDKDAVYKKRLLVRVADFYFQLLGINKLDFTLMFPNLIGAIGRTCANKYHQHKTYRESLKYILKVFKLIKKKFENTLNDNQKNYLILKTEIESFITLHKRSTNIINNDIKEVGLLDEKLLKKLRKMLDSFKEIKVSKIESEENVIDWK